MASNLRSKVARRPVPLTTIMTLTSLWMMMVMGIWFRQVLMRQIIGVQFLLRQNLKRQSLLLFESWKINAEKAKLTKMRCNKTPK